MYTPFRGESFECCANEGCKATKAEFDLEASKNQGATDLRGYSGYYDAQMELSDWARQNHPQLPVGRSANCPVIHNGSSIKGNNDKT